MHEVWSMGPPLQPLRFEKVGAQVGVQGQAGEVVGEGQELRGELWNPLAGILPAGPQKQVTFSLLPYPISGEM